MAYEHGIKVLENATSVPRPVTNPVGVPVIFGTAPVHQVASPADVTNVPVLVNTFAEAVAAFGYSNNYAAYTLCEAMDAFFKAFSVGPIVMVNVLDASTGVSASGTATVADGQATFEMDIVASTIAIKVGDTALVADTDYTYSYDENGYLVVTILDSTKAADGATLTLGTGVKKINTAAAKCGVTAVTLIGSYTAATGATTGLECLRKVYPATGRFPSLILAPGYSDATVAAALVGKCEDISGLFRCECVFDLAPATLPTVEALTTAKNGLTSEHMIVVYPKVMYNGVAMDYSALYAAMLSYKDATEEDGAPTLRQSNNDLPITAVVDASGAELFIDHTLAGEINGLGIVTAVNHGGFVSWGNNTAAYPSSTDPKDRWIGIRRFFSWWGNSFIVNYFDRVDDPVNGKLVEAVVDSENIRGNSYVSSGKCAGMRMEYNADDNTAEDVMDGKITFRMYLAPYTPAEKIVEVLEFDPDMLEAALIGGEE